MRIVFVGMPGCGKTTWSKWVAKYLGYPYFDLDRLIEVGEGQTIPFLFYSLGEEGFRQLESQYLKEFLNSSPEKSVLATGGGTPCFNSNMDLLKKSGAFTLFLDLSPNALVHRIANSKNKRPLFEGLSEEAMRAKVLALRQLRLPFYQRASIKLIARNHFTAAAIKKAIETKLNLEPQSLSRF